MLVVFNQTCLAEYFAALWIPYIIYFLTKLNAEDILLIWPWYMDLSPTENKKCNKFQEWTEAESAWIWNLDTVKGNQQSLVISWGIVRVSWMSDNDTLNHAVYALVVVWILILHLIALSSVLPDCECTLFYFLF